MSCENCFKGYQIPGQPVGSILAEYGGAYFTPKPTNEASTHAVICLTDLFGLTLQNIKIMADKMALELKCDVWVPDMFVNGVPILAADQMSESKALMPERPQDKFTYGMIFRLIYLLFPRILIIWRNRPSVMDARVTAVIKKIREQKTYKKIGAVGFCLGASVGIRIAPTSGLLDSLVLCHPGGTSLAEIEAIPIPTSWVCAENDTSFDSKKRNEAEAIFAKRAKGDSDYVPYEFVDHKGTTHGFACRPNLAYPEVKEGYLNALSQTIGWFHNTLINTSL